MLLRRKHDRRYARGVPSCPDTARGGTAGLARGRVMRFAYFTHSIASCWNHGNAHFLRGVLRELQSRGHEVRIFEPAEGWSRANLVGDHGNGALCSFAECFPGLRPEL